MINRPDIVTAHEVLDLAKLGAVHMLEKAFTEGRVRTRHADIRGYDPIGTHACSQRGNELRTDLS